MINMASIRLTMKRYPTLKPSCMHLPYHQAQILLEELRDAYGMEYTIQGIDIGKKVQKEPWFTAINPNGRIPVLVDHDNDDLAVFEGNAILSYLTRKYDLEHKFSFRSDDDDYTRAESWIGWQHGGIGPM